MSDDIDYKHFIYCRKFAIVTINPLAPKASKRLKVSRKLKKKRGGLKLKIPASALVFPSTAGAGQTSTHVNNESHSKVERKKDTYSESHDN